ncbi:Tyrosine-protein phosphatase YopH [Pandoraea terrae]|uniref:protein-tyrosine-phosphatase n=1 Tax=Pandoraea terrae TaxID=1537710 RepID=A0A5E4T7B2_9BURK|nr:protein-tyrosine phosphatase family protein [Pandoraea terrae]VVD84156.1 Tyrosine-protein phosphatase YopH [Pandoraea terrae]
MTGIATQVPASRMGPEDLRTLFDTVRHSPSCNNDAVLGVNKRGHVVLFAGWQFLLHPMQTLRAQSLIADHAQKHGCSRFTFLPRMDNQDLRKWLVRNLDDKTRSYMTIEDRPRRPHHRRTAQAQPKTYPALRQTTLYHARRTYPAHSPAELKCEPTATQADPRQAVHDALGTKDNVTGLYERMTAAGEDCGVLFLSGLPTARYPAEGVACHTMVTAPHGTSLPANVVNIAAQDVAIACQYPIRPHVTKHFEMLMAQAPSILVILASATEIDELPAWSYGATDPQHWYFSNALTAGRIHVNPQALGRRSLTAQAGEIETYRLTLATEESSVSFPVLHVSRWSRVSDPSASDIRALVREIDIAQRQHPRQVTGQPVLGAVHRDAPLPVIHCRRGAGRTGVLIGAMALLNDKGAALEDIVTDMRMSRNPDMVATTRHLDTLIEIAEDNGNPLRSIHPPRVVAASV